MELLKETTEITKIVSKGRERITAEDSIIVPDVKPDILKILQTEAYSVITSKKAENGYFDVSGKVYVTVLYMPDRENDCIKGLSTVFEFKERISSLHITDSSALVLDTEVLRADCSMINSRKINIKAVVAVDYEILGTESMQYACDTAEDSAQLIKRDITFENITADEECEFMVREGVSIPSGKPSVDEVLKVDAVVLEKEIKSLSGKIIAKGTVKATLLYTSAEQSVEYAEFEIPFTEVFDVAALHEDDSCEARLNFCEITVNLSEDSDGDRRIADFEFLMNIHVRASKAATASLIDDCYFCGKKTELTLEEIKLDTACDTISSRNNLREIITADSKLPEVVSIYNTVVRTEITKSTADRGRIIVEGHNEVYIQYISDSVQTPVYTLKRDIPFSYMLDCPNAAKNMICSAAAETLGVSSTLNSGGEIEFKGVMNIKARAWTNQSIRMITDASVSDCEEQKGIVIYFIQPGDTLWKIAKSYAVAVENILCCNGLEEDSVLSVGDRIIIPSN